MPIKDDQILQDFLANRNLAPATIKRYLTSLQHYSNATGMSLSDLIKEAENEEDQRLRMRERSIKKHFLEYKEYLQSRDYTQLTISTSFTVIRTFYKDFDIFLPYMKISKKSNRVETIENLPNTENISYALKFANLKYRAIILLMSSSGMGKAEILSLTYHDFLKSIESYVNISTDVDEITDILTKKHDNNELIVATWHIIRIKTNYPYYTFSTYESIDAILNYLKSDPPESENSFLFRTRQSQQLASII